MTDTSGAMERLLAAADGGSPPRADARRNVARLVEAARAAVHEVGLDVTAHEIARRAGVGIGTFYRRVPSRQLLLEAVLHELLGELCDSAERALKADDSWQGFCDFAEGYVHLRSASCGVNAALGPDGARTVDVEEPVGRLRDRFASLVGRAQQDGVLRADVTWEDVAFLLAGVVPTDHTLGMQAPEMQWRRNLDVLLDGLRPVRPVRIVPR